MKKIEAVIRHHKLDDVKAALIAIGIDGITVTEARGFGRHKGTPENFRGVAYTADLQPKVKIELAIQDHLLDRVVQAISANAKTGEIGDGRIFVQTLLNCTRIRNAETGEDAV